ncbi:MAG: DMT family transporter [Geodermatophilaceae bacterium]|nr:DMT family transporter [Geodermatophilaceae bacterium]
MSRRGWLLFIAMGLIWGIPYLLIKVAVEELAPSTLVLVRTALAAVLLLPIAFARGQVRLVLSRWWPLVLFTVVEICIPWLLLGFAELRLSSSLTGLLIAAVPLVGALIAARGPAGEQLGTRRLAGLLLGAAGVAALVGFEVGAGDAGAIAAIAGVAVCYAIGPVILSRSLSDLPQLGTVAVALGLAAVLYLPVGLAQAPRSWPSADVVLAVAMLAVVCTAVAFLLFFALIAEVGAARSVVITYVNPAVAVLLGVSLLDETFTAATAVGFVLILLGSVLATSRTRTPATAGEEICEVPGAPVADSTRR